MYLVTAKKLRQTQISKISLHFLKKRAINLEIVKPARTMEGADDTVVRPSASRRRHICAFPHLTFPFAPLHAQRLTFALSSIPNLSKRSSCRAPRWRRAAR